LRLRNVSGIRRAVRDEYITQNHTETFKVPSNRGTYHDIYSIHQYMMGTIVK